MKKLVKVPRQIPKWLHAMLFETQAWVVGSCVEWILEGGEGEKPRDIDIMVPPEQWQRACKFVPEEVLIQLNRFGGLSFRYIARTEEKSWFIDMFPGRLDDLLAMTQSHVPTKALRLKPLCLVEQKPF